MVKNERLISVIELQRVRMKWKNALGVLCDVWSPLYWNAGIKRILQGMVCYDVWGKNVMKIEQGRNALREVRKDKIHQLTHL